MDYDKFPSPDKIREISSKLTERFEDELRLIPEQVKNITRMLMEHREIFAMAYLWLTENDPSEVVLCQSHDITGTKMLYGTWFEKRIVLKIKESKNISIQEMDDNYHKNNVCYPCNNGDMATNDGGMIKMSNEPKPIKDYTEFLTNQERMKLFRKENPELIDLHLRNTQQAEELGVLRKVQRQSITNREKLAKLGLDITMPTKKFKECVDNIKLILAQPIVETITQQKEPEHEPTETKTEPVPVVAPKSEPKAEKKKKVDTKNKTDELYKKTAKRQKKEKDQKVAKKKAMAESEMMAADEKAAAKIHGESVTRPSAAMKKWVMDQGYGAKVGTKDIAERFVISQGIAQDMKMALVDEGYLHLPSGAIEAGEVLRTE